MKISSQFQKCLETIHNFLDNSTQCYIQWYGMISQDEFNDFMELNKIINVYFIEGTSHIKFEYNDLQKKKFKEFYNELVLKDDFS